MAQWRCPKCREFVTAIMPRNLQVFVKQHECPKGLKVKDYEVPFDGLSCYDRNFLNELLIRW